MYESNIVFNYIIDKLIVKTNFGSLRKVNVIEFLDDILTDIDPNFEHKETVENVVKENIMLAEDLGLVTINQTKQTIQVRFNPEPMRDHFQDILAVTEDEDLLLLNGNRKRTFPITKRKRESEKLEDVKKRRN